MALSSTGRKYQDMCLKHPSLVMSVQLICIKPWKNEDLVNAANFLLSELTHMPAAKREDIAYLLSAFHTELQKQDGGVNVAGTHGNITNTNFELFVERFVYLYETKTKELKNKHVMIEKTLRTVEESTTTGQTLNNKLTHEEVVITQKQQDRAITEQHTRLVKKTKAKRDKLKKLIPQYEEAHKRAIFKAAAIVKETKSILGGFDDKDLADIRAMQKPDTEIEDLLAAIIIIVKSPSADLTWNRGAKRMMANIERFKEDISGFDEVELPEGTLQVLRPYINKPHFAPGYLLTRTGNQAIGSLVLYVRGVVRYNYIMQSHVKPLHQKVSETTERLELVSEKLESMEKKLKDLRYRLRALGENFEDACVERSQQKELVDNLVDLLQKGSEFDKLLSNLTNDWKESLRSLEGYNDTLSSEVILATAYSVYMGPYDDGFRQEMLNKHWYNCLVNQGVVVKFNQSGSVMFGLAKSKMESVPVTPTSTKRELTTADANEKCPDTPASLIGSEANYLASCEPIAETDVVSYRDFFYTLARSMVDEETIKSWLTHGYKWVDIQNLALLCTPLRRAVICIDPTNRFSRYLKELHVDGQDLVELDFFQRDGNFVGALERSISSGSLVVIQNIDNEIDAIFYPLIYLSLTNIVPRDNRKQIIKFNGHRLQYHPNFRLVMVCRLVEPNLPDELASLCTIVNLAPNKHFLKADIQRKSLALLSPDLLKYEQELMYTAFTSICKLNTMDQNIMTEIQCKAGSHDIWNNTEKLEWMSTQRKQLHQILLTVEKEYTKVSLQIQHSHFFSTELTRLFNIHHALASLERHYQVNYNDFMYTFHQSLSEVVNTDNITGWHEQKFVYQYDSALDTNADEETENTVSSFEKKQFDSIKDDDVSKIKEKFKGKFFTNLKRILSLDHFSLLQLVYFLVSKLDENGDIDETFVELLQERNESPFQSKLVTTEHVVLFNKPDWLSLADFNTLTKYAERYPPFVSFVQKLSQMPSMVKYWCEKARPEISQLPQANQSSSPEPTSLDALRVLAIKALRMDRLYYTLTSWSANCISNETDLPTKGKSILQSLNRTCPTLILKCTGTEKESYMSYINKLAETEKVKVQYICLSHVNRDATDAVLTSMVQQDFFLVIDNVHLTSREHLTSIYKRLIRLQKQYDESNHWRIFLITSNPYNIIETFLKFCTVVNWTSFDSPTNENSDSEELSWSSILLDGITKALKNIPVEILDQLTKHPPTIRTLIFTLCVMDGYVSSFYADERKLVPLADAGFLKAVEWVIAECGEGRTDSFLYHEVVYLLVEEIYNYLDDENPVKDLALDIICRTSLKELSSIQINCISIPVPPTSVQPRDYVAWFTEKFSSWLKNNKATERSGVKEKCLKERSLAKSQRFLDEFRLVFQRIMPNFKENVDGPQILRHPLHESILQCKEGLPKLIDIKEEEFSGPYPALQSFLSKECKHFSERLLAINKQLKIIENTIVGGEQLIPKQFHDAALSLSLGATPPMWLHTLSIFEKVSLKRWLRDHLRAVHENPTSYFYTKDDSKISTLTLTAFEDIPAVITILKYDKAAQDGITMDTVGTITF